MPRLSLWKEKKSNDYQFFDKAIRGMYDAGGTGILLHKYLGTNPQGTQLTVTTTQTAPNVLTVGNVAGVNFGDTVTATGVNAGTTVIATNPQAGTVTLSAPTTTIISAGALVGFSPDATQPSYVNQSANNIQDLLLLENRDRKYDTSVYSMRGIYQRSDNDFDLTQFGLFLQNGTIMMTFHYNEMIDILGRRIMNGDVVELLHLKDNDAAGGDLPAALKRFYVASDCSYATEGFSPTWYPHLWRCKFNPLVDSQEYKDILKNLAVTNTLGPQGTSIALDANGKPILDANGNTIPGGSTLTDIMSTYNKYQNINDTVVAQAEVEVPLSGYDVSKFYSLPSDAQGNVAKGELTADTQLLAVDTQITADQGTYSPITSQNPTGYLTGDGLAPNGLPVVAGIAFPVNPHLGDYVLRLDYLPNRLFRFDGRRWVKVEDNVRTRLTAGDPNNNTLRNSFANDANTMTVSNGDVVPERQSLSQALRPKADL